MYKLSLNYFVIITSGVVQSCQQRLAQADDAMKKASEKDEKKDDEIQRDVTDLRSQNTDLNEQLVCTLLSPV